MSNVKLDVAVLKIAYERDANVRMMCDIMLDRARGRIDTTLERLRRVAKMEADANLSREAGLKLMQLWQRAGCGRFIEGSTERDTRFFWDVNIPSVMEEVTGRKSAMTLAAEAKGKRKPKGVLPAPVPRVRLPKLSQLVKEVSPAVLERAPAKRRAAKPNAVAVPAGVPMPKSGKRKTFRGMEVSVAGVVIKIPFDMTPIERKEFEAIVKNLKGLE